MKGTKRTVRLTTMLLVLAMLAGVLFACGGGASSTEGGTAPAGGGDTGGAASPDGGYDLVFWTYSDMVLNDQAVLLDGWIEEFLAENDDVNSITVAAKDDADLLTSLMAGVGLPDMFLAAARDGKTFRAAIDIMDLTELYQDDEWANGFYENARYAVTVGGTPWAVPFMCHIPLIFRNTTVCEAAGIDWENEPLETWDDFYDQCERVIAAGYDATITWATGNHNPPGAILACDYPNLTMGVENGKTTIKAEECVRTFETILKMEEYSNGMTYNSQPATEAFKTDKLCFLLAGPWAEPEYMQAGTQYDIQLVPAYEAGGWTGGTQGQDWMYGVDSGDAGRNDAILRWLKKMGSFETQQQFTKVIGRSTLREDVMNDEEALTLEVAKALSNGLNCGMPQMDFNHSSVFWYSAIVDVAPLVASGELTPEQGAEAFIEGINALYAEAGE